MAYLEESANRRPNELDNLRIAVSGFSDNIGNHARVLNRPIDMQSNCALQSPLLAAAAVWCVMQRQSAGVLLKQLAPEEHGFSVQRAGAGERPPITCHVLDTATGTPAVGLAVALSRSEDGTRCARPSVLP